MASTNSKRLNALASVGIYGAAMPESQQIGVDSEGNPLWANSKLLNSKDLRIGQAAIGIIANMLEQFGVFKDGDRAKLDSHKEKAGSVEALTSLDTLSQAANEKGFTEKFLTDTGQNVADPEALDIATSYFQNWGRMSPSQKSLSVATLSLHKLKGVNGEQISLRKLPATEGTGYNALDAAGAYKLIQKGYNATSLAENWESLNDIHELAGGHSNPEDIAAMASGQGLLGVGKEGRVANNVSAKSLSGMGWFASPHHGVGAITGAADSQVPANYTQITQVGNKKVAVPTASLPTVAAGSGSGNLANTAAGHGGVSDSAQKVYSTWKGAHTTKANNGVIGGSAMVSGLYAMSRTNPLLFSSAVAASFVDPKNSSVNYSDDTHYLAHLSLSSLDRLVSGEKRNKQEISIQAVLQDMGAGKGKELNKATFDSLTNKLRAEFASKGVKSKADAYALTNQAFAERRINAVDLVGMQKTFNMLYDTSGMETAHKLLVGKEKGIVLAGKKGRASGVRTAVPRETLLVKAPKLSKEELRMKNRARYMQPIAASQPQMQAEV